MSTHSGEAASGSNARILEAQISHNESIDLVPILFHGEDGISMNFEYKLYFLTQSKIKDVKDLIGQTALVKINPIDSTHPSSYFSGAINKAELIDSDSQDYQQYRLTLVPWLASLRKNRKTCRYNNASAKAIIESVLSAYSQVQYDMSQVSGGNKKRPVCIQYQESDLAFISRLMQQEGIFYYFAQSKDDHQLIFADQISAYGEYPRDPLVYDRFHLNDSEIQEWISEFKNTNTHPSQRLQ